MDARLSIDYDQIGDLLFMDVCQQHPGQDTDEIDDGVIVKLNLATGAIEFVEILFFKAWLNLKGEIRIPAVNAAFRLASAPNGDPPPSHPDATLTIRYNPADDTLTLNTRPPNPTHRPAEIGDGATAKINDATGEIETLEIRAFMSRAEKDGAVILPISATLRPAQIPAAAD